MFNSKEAAVLKGSLGDVKTPPRTLLHPLISPGKRESVQKAQRPLLIS